MPELPDLQVFSRNLTKTLKGKKLESVTLKVEKKSNATAKKLKEVLEGETLTKVTRAGKELHFEFSNGHILAMHLMLHGQLYLFDGANNYKYTVIELIFDDNKGLALTDFQQAATPTLDPQPNDVTDALDVTFKYLSAKLQATRTAVKTVLMDQRILRGIGNAYADEILYDAKISPFSASNKIPDDEIKVLVKSIKEVLEDAEKQIIKTHPDIISGEVRDFLKVHLPKQKQTFTGAAIYQKPVGPRKTYYTGEQQLFD